MVQRVVTCIVIEKKKKLIKFAFIFHLFSQGRSMTKYEQMQTLLVFLKVLNHPSKHWSDYVSWVIIESLHRVVLIAIEEANMVSKISSLFANKLTTINNQSWISIHYYVVVVWKHVHVLLALE
jgi:hypothetical protein